VLGLLGVRVLGGRAGLGLLGVWVLGGRAGLGLLGWRGAGLAVLLGLLEADGREDELLGGLAVGLGAGALAIVFAGSGRGGVLGAAGGF